MTGVCADKKGTPIDNVKVISKKAITPIVYTNNKGEYTLLFDGVDTINIEFRTSDLVIQKSVVLKKSKTKVEEVRFSFLQQGAVDVQGEGFPSYGPFP